MLLSKVFGKDSSQLFAYQDDFKKSLVKFEPSYVFCDNSTNVGIEIEVERVESKSNVLSADGGGWHLWHNTDDGSLRNSGREFVSIPVKGSNIEFALTVLHAHLHKSKLTSSHEFSDRTSVHIHVDFSKLSVEDVQSFVAVYMAVEPLLYNFVGGDRSENIFAVPLNETISHDNSLSKLFGNKMTAANMDYITRHWTKYTGINLLPLRSQNTIEFRHMVGTCDIRRLCNWINIILQMRSFAVKNKFDVLYKRLTEMNTISDYGAFLNEVFYQNDYLLRSINLDLEKELERTTTLLKSILVKEEIKLPTKELKGTLFEKLGFISSDKTKEATREEYHRVFAELNRGFAVPGQANLWQLGNQQVDLNANPVIELQPEEEEVLLAIDQVFIAPNQDM